MVEMKAGDVIKINPEHVETVRGMRGNIHVSRVAMRTAAEMVESSLRDLFRSLEAMYPELKGWHYSLNGCGQITIRRPKSDREKELDVENNKMEDETL